MRLHAPKTKAGRRPGLVVQVLEEPETASGPRNKPGPNGPYNVQLTATIRRAGINRRGAPACAWAS
jgi:hypothetical protein